MTFDEAMAWVAYRDKYGSLNPMWRQEQMGAIVAMQVNRMRGGKANVVDFMPNEPKPPITLVDAMEQWA